MFIPRMWSDEVERIGKQRCTPLGYTLQSIGDTIGLGGLLALLAVFVYLTYRVIAGTFHPSLVWLFAIPLAIGIVGSAIVSFSWSLAARKKFRYDCEQRVSEWVERGEERCFTFADWQASAARKV